VGQTRQDDVLQILEDLAPMIGLLGNLLGQLIDHRIWSRAGQDIPVGRNTEFRGIAPRIKVQTHTSHVCRSDS